MSRLDEFRELAVRLKKLSVSEYYAKWESAVTPDDLEEAAYAIEVLCEALIVNEYCGLDCKQNPMGNNLNQCAECQIAESERRIAERGKNEHD